MQHDRPSREPSEKAERNGPAALVIDDEASVRLVARRILERHGWVVREAAGGAQALGELIHPPLRLSSI